MNSCDIYCKIGISLPFYREKKEWLDEETHRRLFFIEESDAPIPEEMAKDKRVRVFALETFLQKEGIARKIGALAAFRKLTIIGEGWKDEIERAQLAAEWTASDGADFGARTLAHMRENFSRPLRSFLALKDQKKNVPAIICGAGPSLKETAPLLSSSGAFIIGAGSALAHLPFPPHLRVALCPHTPLPNVHLEAPLVIQGRVHPASVQGEEIFWIPDSHFGADRFDAGWTVGNAAVALAAHLGCNPIVVVGMDLCYSGEQKYADTPNVDTSHLIQTVDRDGNTVFTQKDWLLAVDWMEAFARAHPHIQFYNATPRGLNIGAPFIQQPLHSFPPRTDLALDCTQAPLEKVTAPTTEEMFAQLWPIWEPLFERELMVDPHPIPLEQKLAIQKELLLEQVRKEHGTCYRYYASGKLYRIERWDGDVKEGVQEAYYESGQLKTKEFFSNGYPDQEQLLYWPNGQLKRRLFFLNGKRDGKEEIWSEAGILIDESNYANGKPIGLHRRFSLKGELIEEIDYLDEKRWNYRGWGPNRELRAEIRWTSETEFEEKKWIP